MIQWYYPMTIKGVIVALTDMFNDLQVVRLADDGTVSKTFKVPITFGPVEKYQYIRKQGEEAKKYYLQLPRLSMVLVGINYAAERATGVNDERHFHDTGISIDKIESFVKDVQPAPYDYTFDLDLRTESMDDLCQLLENILPYFNPSLYLKIKEFNFLNIERNLQVTLDSVGLDFTLDQEENQKREVNAKIGITVKGWQYRPLQTAKIIKYIKTQYFVSTSAFSNVISANLLVDSYSTSGVQHTSAAPVSASYDTSATFSINIGGTSAMGYSYTSGTPHL